MAYDDDNLAALNPFEIIKRSTDTDDEFLRVEVTLHPVRDGPAQPSTLAHRPWIVDGIGEHYHPKQEEYFEVRAGELRVVMDGEEHTLSVDEEIAIPPRTNHSHWNPADRPARIVVEHRPARESEALLETLYTLAQLGETDEQGIPGLLQSMVIQDAFPDYAYRTDRPVIVQKGLATLLGPIGRMLGYTPVHSMDEIEGTQLPDL